MPDYHTAIVTPQIPVAYVNGGIATFIGHFLRLLRATDDRITVIFTEPPQKPEREWRPFFDQLGIKLISLQSTPIRTHSGYPPETRIAELACEALPSDCDVVYFADWRANGVATVRRKRQSGKRLPVAVTVLHGSTSWHREGQQLWPSSYEELLKDFDERYTVQHSDYVIAPSQYIIDWSTAHRWKLPHASRVRALHYPFFPTPGLHNEPLQTAHADRFRRVLFYGRIETRKGFEVFIKALLALQNRACLEPIQEIVLLGNEGTHTYVTAAAAAEMVEESLGIPVTIVDKLDSLDAQRYLARYVADTLVVIPSRAETLGFTIVEASLIDGLNMICSNAGGITEIFSPDSDQLFEPYFRPLAARLEQWLSAPPLSSAKLARYPYEKINEQWLTFHREACMVAHQFRALEAESAANGTYPSTFSPAAPVKTADKSVDVCIPHYNLGKYLPFLLESLEKQTSTDFNVIVVDDGSTDPESCLIFEQMRARYTPRGWHFVNQTNEGVCATRNNAAALGTAEFICFMDADNIAAPTMIETFLRAIRASGDDCLTCYMYSFEGERTPYFAGILTPPLYTYVPTGNVLEAGLLENPFGDLNSIMKRQVFEAIGGFTMDQDRYINQEDRELLTRIALAGYKMDVIPEFLFFYRHRDDSRLRSTENFLNERRVLRTYEEKLEPLGLAHLPAVILGMKYRAAHMQMIGTMFSDEIDFLVHRVRWYNLLKALRKKIEKNVRKLFQNRTIPR